MITRLFSAALRGVEAQEVEVEVNARGADKPMIIVVGLPDAAVRESSQRVISAIGASALFPMISPCLHLPVAKDGLAVA